MFTFLQETNMWVHRSTCHVRYQYWRTEQDTSSTDLDRNTQAWHYKHKYLIPLLGFGQDITFKMLHLMLFYPKPKCHFFSMQISAQHFQGRAVLRSSAAVLQGLLTHLLSIPWCDLQVPVFQAWKGPGDLNILLRLMQPELQLQSKHTAQSGRVQQSHLIKQLQILLTLTNTSKK